MLVFVFLKAAQQLNVVNGHYIWVPIVSYGMAFMELYVISVVVVSGFSLALWFCVGTGAGIGAICAMRLHGVKNAGSD